MKSSWELALERTGGKLEEVSEDKKAKIADIESRYKAKMAEAELSFNERRLKAMGDVAAMDQIQQDLSVEMASLRSKCENEKEKIRGES